MQPSRVIDSCSIDSLMRHVWRCGLVLLLLSGLAQQQASATSNDWSVMINAAVGDYNSQITFGEFSDASDGYDVKYDGPAYSTAAPVNAYFDHTGWGRSDTKFWYDIQSIGSSRQWAFTTESTFNGQNLTLKWYFSNVPSGYQITLTDTTTGQSVDMMVETSYSYVSDVPHQFTISAVLPEPPPPSPSNSTPVLTPISGQSMNEGAIKTVTLTASDVDVGDTLHFSVAGLPNFATLTDNGNGSATLRLAPGYAAAGDYNITITAIDSGAPSLSSSRTFTLSVINANAPPQANAGVDEGAKAAAVVTLSGSNSSDSDGTITAYSWSQIGGPAVGLNNATTATASFIAPVVSGSTALSFRLTVTDNGGAIAIDQVIIMVIPAGKSDLAISAMGSPLMAPAGGNVVVSNTVVNSGAADAESNFDVGLYLLPEPVVFASNFDAGTLQGWSPLKSGSISVVSDAVDGWVLKSLQGWSSRKSGGVSKISDVVGRALEKMTYVNPNGGQTLLASAVSDFELTLNTKRLTTSRATANRYSVSDARGNGYGLFINSTTGHLQLEKRTTWGSTIIGSAPLSGGMAAGKWYTLRLTRIGNQLTANAYLGKVTPAAAIPVATVSTTNTSYTRFTRANVNGGHDYYTDNVRVVKLLNSWPTDGSEIFLGKRLVYSLAAGASSVDGTVVTIPAGVSPGTYAIATKVDMYAVVPESNELNNVLLGLRQFVITAP